jgi:hypothetical protein
LLSSQKFFNDMRADEARAAGYEESHGLMDAHEGELN